MKRYSKLLVFFVVLAIMAAPMVVTATGNNTKLAGTTLVVYTGEGELSDGVNAQIGEFEKKTGAKVKVIAEPFTMLWDKLSIDLAAKSSAYDVLVMTIETAAPYTTAGWVEPLDKYINNPKIAAPDVDIKDFMKSQLDAYKDKKGRICGLPYKPDVELYYYRKDLFEDPKEQKAFKEKYGYDLAPAKTWEQYFQIAEFFTRPEKKLYGSLFMGKKHIQLLTNFTTRYYGTGKQFLDKNYMPTINSPEGIKVMKSFRWELLNTTPPGTDNWEWPQTNTAFLQGLCAQHITWPGLSKMVETPDGPWGKSEVVGKVGITVPPGWKDGKPSSMMGGWFASVSAYSKNKVAAYKLAEFLTSKDGEPLKIASGNDPCRLSNFKKFAAKYPIYPVMQKALDMSYPLPKIPEWPEMWQIAQEEVHAGITGVKSEEQACADMDKRWKEVLKKAGYIK
jgi:ABC-type glycerol-3-phosphate transport system substrate-binding protein